MPLSFKQQDLLNPRIAFGILQALASIMSTR